MYDFPYFSICLVFFILNSFVKKVLHFSPAEESQEDLDWSCLGPMACANLIALTPELAYSDWLELDHGLILSLNASAKASCLAGEIPPKGEQSRR